MFGGLFDGTGLDDDIDFRILRAGDTWFDESGSTRHLPSGFVHPAFRIIAETELLLDGARMCCNPVHDRRHKGTSEIGREWRLGEWNCT